jgi:hypothetical protein
MILLLREAAHVDKLGFEQFYRGMVALMQKDKPGTLFDKQLVLSTLIKLASLQEKRVEAMSAQEQKLGIVSPRLDRMIWHLEESLVRMQRIRFDLGLDQRVLPLSWSESTERQVELRQKADVQRQCVEAYAEAEQAFKSLEAEHPIGDAGRLSVQNSDNDVNR